MKTLENKLNSLAWKAHFKAMNLKDRAKNAFKNEDGDTNFLSIIIILAIVLIIAIVFIAFKDKVIVLVESAWNKFAGSFSSQDKAFNGNTPTV